MMKLLMSLSITISAERCPFHSIYYYKLIIEIMRKGENGKHITDSFTEIFCKHRVYAFESRSVFDDEAHISAVCTIARC